MEPRQEKLLKLIIENYIKTAEPIGSKFIVEVGDLEVSAPTIRNEMRELENSGFLTQPHTSAGRIPTEKGYQYYVETLMQPQEISKKNKEILTQIIKQTNDEIKKIKNTVKKIAEIANNAIIVAFDKDNIYYTGISNLFTQPEFLDQVNLSSISSMFDQCENCLDSLFVCVFTSQIIHHKSFQIFFTDFVIYQEQVISLPVFIKKLFPGIQWFPDATAFSSSARHIK